MDPDRTLLDFIRRALASGDRKVAIPYALLSAASEHALTAARELCAREDATLEIEL